MKKRVSTMENDLVQGRTNESEAAERAVSINAAVIIARCRSFRVTLWHGSGFGHEPRHSRGQLERQHRVPCRLPQSMMRSSLTIARRSSGTLAAEPASFPRRPCSRPRIMRNASLSVPDGNTGGRLFPPRSPTTPRPLPSSAPWPGRWVGCHAEALHVEGT